jgi:hypothetical protein
MDRPGKARRQGGGSFADAAKFAISLTLLEMAV